MFQQLQGATVRKEQRLQVET